MDLRRRTWRTLVPLAFCWAAEQVSALDDQQHIFSQDACPDYTNYASYPQ